MIRMFECIFKEGKPIKKTQLLFISDWDGYPVSGYLEINGKKYFFEILESFHKTKEDFEKFWILLLPSQIFTYAREVIQYEIDWNENGRNPILNLINYRAQCAMTSVMDVRKNNPQITKKQWEIVENIRKKEKEVNTFINQSRKSVSEDNKIIAYGKFIGELKPSTFLNKTFIEWENKVGKISDF
ncbi:hypothetical protein BJM49_05335 [Listeria monocytogenes]|nr:hypothetical protein [Listeria monocytogenes]ECB9716812.1 hypothetical protein [Listeria monocytogenes]OFG21118.1 hypothetical protein BJM49_05335 [Listeria monocytogenes]